MALEKERNHLCGSLSQSVLRYKTVTFCSCFALQQTHLIFMTDVITNPSWKETSKTLREIDKLTVGEHLTKLNLCLIRSDLCAAEKFSRTKYIIKRTKLKFNLSRIFKKHGLILVYHNFDFNTVCQFDRVSLKINLILTSLPSHRNEETQPETKPNY